MFLLCRCGGLRGLGCFGLVHPHSRVRHWDRLWSSLVKGEGEFGGCVGLVVCPALHFPSGLRIKSAMTGRGRLVLSCSPAHPTPLDCGSSPQ